jgi:DNA-binding MarR family transcriptional regulator
MSESSYDSIKLENQLCFPLYACSKEIVRKYKVYLDDIDLTYTQYIAMMVLWERKEVTVKELGKELFLDSGTLTPLLKKLEQKGYIYRHRSTQDERNLLITITPQGELLKENAVNVQAMMGKCVQLEPQESDELSRLLNKILGGLCTDETYRNTQ